MTITRKLKNLNIIILLILLLLGFAVFYFLYHRQRSQAYVYVQVSLMRPQNIALNIVQNSIPYWLDDSIKIGDKEGNPLGGTNAVVTDKESVESFSYGRFTNLTLKIDSIKDKTGIYLYKNKPLSVGTLLDLKLDKTNVSGIITYLDLKPPEAKKIRLLVIVYGKNIDKWQAESLRIGSEIKNNKNETIAKIRDLKILPPSSTAFTVSSNTNNFYIAANTSDLNITAEIQAVKKDDGNSYFIDIEKVKVGENLFLPFKEIVTNYPIVKVEEIR